MSDHSHLTDVLALKTNSLDGGIKDTNMKAVSLEELLEAGCHFGHQTTRHNPKARDFVFEARDGIHIIDLEKTKQGLDEAVEFVHKLAARGGTMIVLGSKRQAAPIVREEYKKAKEAGVQGLYVVTNRWIGGILTNFPEVTKNFNRLKDITSKLQNDFEKSKYTKKEISLWEKEKNKLESFYGGISDMTRPADALFIIDTHLEQLAVREAKATGVKIVGITDTNADPTDIDYPIPANDDAVGSIKLITTILYPIFCASFRTSSFKDSNPIPSPHLVWNFIPLFSISRSAHILFSNR